MKPLMRLLKKIKAQRLIVLTPLVLLLTSCVKSEPVACPVLPAAFIAHLDKTTFKGRTYGDVTQYAVILKRERDVCLERVDKIREWQVENAPH